MRLEFRTQKGEVAETGENHEEAEEQTESVLRGGSRRVGGKHSANMRRSRGRRTAEVGSAAGAGMVRELESASSLIESQSGFPVVLIEETSASERDRMVCSKGPQLGRVLSGWGNEHDCPMSSVGSEF